MEGAVHANTPLGICMNVKANDLPEEGFVRASKQKGGRNRGRKGENRMCAWRSTPHPGSFDKRAWILLIRETLTFLESTKSAQQYASRGVIFVWKDREPV